MFRSKSRLWINILIALALTAALAATAFALASGPADEDASVYSTDPALNQNADKIRAEAGTPNCAASRTRWTYLKWDVSDAKGKAGDYAKITLTADLINLGSATPGQVSIGLYKTTDGWTESAVTAGTGPAIGDLLVSIPVPEVPGILTFEGANLVTYLMGEANNDGVASIVVALTGNCGESSVLVRAWSKDQVNADLAPTLDLRAGGPTAVDLTTTSAERTSLPLYAGLGAVALLVVAGLAISRRRTA